MKGAQSLDDTLTYTAGVTAEPFGFSTRGDFVQVRGLDAPEYRDNLQYLFGFYNNTRQDIYTLEQVEGDVVDDGTQATPREGFDILEKLGARRRVHKHRV